MKQVKLVGEKEFEFNEVSVPEVDPNQVLIKVKACGICGSDIHSYKGKHPFVDPPIVLGHEYLGIVEKKGSEVSSEIEVGDLVTSELALNCGECYNCRHGRPQICKNAKHLGNVGKDGAMQEYFTMRSDKVHVLPNDSTKVEGVMTEPTAVGVHAVRKSNFTVGDTVLVIGAGVIGNLTAQVLSAAGADKVIVAEMKEGRIEKANEVGLETTVNTGKSDLSAWLNKNIGTENLDLIYDCVGIEATLNMAIENARKGSQIMLVGVPEEDLTLNMAFVQDRELDISGTLQYIREDFSRAINLIASDKVDVKPLVTNSYPFLEYKTAFETAIDQAKATKGMMKVMLDYD